MNGQKISGWVLFSIFLIILGGCTTAISKPPVEIEIEKNVKLPLEVDGVWYRTDKIRLFGLAYEESGTLIVNEGYINFSYEGGKITIPQENIKKVGWGKMSPDITNDWVIVYYDLSGKDGVAAFKGAPFSGSGKESKIYSAILHIMKSK